jgi:carbamoyl-phosphate synthase large subunit
MAVYPPIALTPAVQADIVRGACSIAKSLGIKGMMNIQYVVQDGVAYVLEVNPRASRTVPYLSKVTGIPMVELATRCMMGDKLRDLGYSSGLWVLEGGQEKGATYAPSFGGRVDAVGSPVVPNPLAMYAIKAPVFSFQKLAKVEPSLGPEMKSTGEVLGIDKTFEGALYKAFVGAGVNFKGDGCVLLTVKEDDKSGAVAIAQELHRSGRVVRATPGTAAAIREAGVPCEPVNKIQAGSPNILDLIMSGGVSLMVNTPGLTETAESEAARIRRACIETGVACVTSIDTATALVRALQVYSDPARAQCLRLEEYFEKA